MSVTLINNFGIGTTDFTAMMATINKSYKGKSEITLSNYDNDTAPAVKVGSVFDCNGAIYLVETADETPSGYPGITNDTMFYLVFDVSALAFVYTETAPTWSDTLQGWYNGNDRYLYVLNKTTDATYGGYQGKQGYDSYKGEFQALFVLTGLPHSYIYTLLSAYATTIGVTVRIKAGDYFMCTDAGMTRTSSTAISANGTTYTQGSGTISGPEHIAISRNSTL